MRQRLTLSEDVYHSTKDERPTHLATHSWRFLETDEQPWQRWPTVGTVWQPLVDHCWVEDACQLVVRNDGKDVIELAVDGALFSTVHPEFSVRIEPAALDRYTVRSLGEPCKITVLVFPK